MLALQLAAIMLSVSAPGETTLLDFGADWCGPCRTMVPVIQQLETAGYPVRRVNIDQERDLAKQFKVHGVPCFVLIVNGREVDRVTGLTDVKELQAMFRKAGFQPGDDPIAKNSPSRGAMASPANFTKNINGPPIELGSNVMNDRVAAVPAIRTSTPNFADEKPRLSKNSAAIQPERNPVVTIPAVANNSPNASGNKTIKNGSSTSPSQFPKTLLASVRLKIEDPNGSSFGSGTIVDVGDGEALILTCAHVFRDSEGQGRISVDIFGPKQLSNIPGKLVHYDLKSDVGLVSIRTNEPVTVAKIAPPGYQVRKGDPVFTVGCNHGGDPTVRESQVNSLDKFLGPPNIQVAGQPVQGRSGGGLFTKDGLVIGVCNAADPSDDEGLFAAVTSIHAELDRTNLAFIYRQPNKSISPAAFASGAPPEMASRMPSGVPNTPSASSTLPVNDRAVGQAICIIRPSEDPKGKSEVIVLDRVSPAFWQQLETERTAQASRQGERR